MSFGARAQVIPESPIPDPSDPSRPGQRHPGLGRPALDRFRTFSDGNADGLPCSRPTKRPHPPSQLCHLLFPEKSNLLWSNERFPSAELPPKETAQTQKAAKQKRVTCQPAAAFEQFEERMGTERGIHQTGPEFPAPDPPGTRREPVMEQAKVRPGKQLPSGHPDVQLHQPVRASVM